MHKLAFFKVATDGIVAHVYEHALIRRMLIGLASRDLWYGLDYDYRGRTYGRVCMVELFLLSHAAQRRIVDLDWLQRDPIDRRVVQAAAEECGVELLQNIEYIGMEFFQAVYAVHAAPMRPLHLLGIEEWQEYSAADAILQRPGISYRQQRSDAYTTKRFTISCPLMGGQVQQRVLALLLVELVGLACLQAVRRNYISYDLSGNRRHSSAHNVSYSVSLRFSRDSCPNSERLTHQLEWLMKNLRDSVEFRERILVVLQQDYQNERSMWLTYDDMFSLVNTVVGANGWRAIAKPEAIQYLLSRITCTVE